MFDQQIQEESAREYYEEQFLIEKENVEANIYCSNCKAFECRNCNDFSNWEGK